MWGPEPREHIGARRCVGAGAKSAGGRDGALLAKVPAKSSEACAARAHSAGRQNAHPRTRSRRGLKSRSFALALHMQR